MRVRDPDASAALFPAFPAQLRAPDTTGSHARQSSQDASAVAQNLAAILDADWPGARLGYWHVQGRHEVDFVIEAGRDCIAVEVKATARWNDRDLAGLRAFLDKTPRCRVAILGYGGRDAVKLGDRLWAVPLAAVLE